MRNSFSEMDESMRRNGNKIINRVEGKDENEANEGLNADVEVRLP